MANSDLLTLTADIVAAHVSNNAISAADLPRAIATVYDSLAGLSGPVAAVVEARAPAVAVKGSVKPDTIICLDCGARQKALKRHIGAAHALTPDQYRAKWNLPASYPMVAPNSTAARSEMAKRIGLGRKPGATAAVLAAAKPGRRKLGVKIDAD